jgi:hypothetical protein
MIQCQVCNKSFTRITASHLVQHNMSVAEYKKMFGNDSILSEGNRKNLARTIESMIKKYGEIEGRVRWEEYRRKQAETNSFEYKKKKYGWTKEKFDEYNKSRATTKKNMISRYGKEDGTKKWEEYCSRQAYAGTAKEYFVEKYGEVEGTKKYEEVCYNKGNAFRGKSLTDVHKLNCRLGTLKHLETLTGKRVCPRYNPKACKSIDMLAENLGVHIQHAENGGEIRLDIGYWVDGYCESENIVVEYFEPWHRKNVERDENRLREIRDFLGCRIIIIREDDDGNTTIEDYKD